ncbi:copper amine oxidase [Amycolatopsis sp. NPDC004378]
MGRFRRTRSAVVSAAAAGVVCLLATTATAVPRFVTALSASGQACGSDQHLSRTFPTGTGWDLCWSTGQEGLILRQVQFTGRDGARHLVLNQVALAEMVVSYDDGSSFDLDVAGYGFDHLLPQRREDCPSGDVLTAGTGPGILCLATATRAPALRTDEVSASGQDLQLSVVSEAAWYKYVSRYTPSDDGTIRLEIGDTGTLSPYLSDDTSTGWRIGADPHQVATAHTHAAYWRLDFNVDGRPDRQAAQQVEQIDSPDAGTSVRPLAITPITGETAARAANSRMWAVTAIGETSANGQHPSWQLRLDGLDHYTGPAESQAYTADDVYFTELHDCERFIDANYANDCARSLDTYLNAEHLTHPVVWARVDFHHLPRQEDTPVMSTHWQGFSIAPRDVFTANPITPRHH